MLTPDHWVDLLYQTSESVVPELSKERRNTTSIQVENMQLIPQHGTGETQTDSG